MSDNARVLWRIAIDNGSPLLCAADFHEISQPPSECQPIRQTTDHQCTVMQLRFQKRLRSTPLVESLRKLVIEGKIQSAWIEKPGGTKRIVLFDGTLLELEPVDSKPKKRRNNTDQHTAPPDEDIDTILSSIDELERQHRAAIQALRCKVQRLRGKQPIPPNPTLPALNRPPICVSFLRSASVTELYYAGIWLPNHDVDNALHPPRRECLFRSEIPTDDYIEHYDIDDLIQPNDTSPYLHDKPTALKNTGFLHFTDQPRTRPAILLHALRHAPFDVLVLLRVLHPDHDTNDEHPNPPPPRERQTRTQICERLGLNPHHSGYKAHFVRGYDIDDVDGKREADEIRAKALVWKELRREACLRLVD